MSLTANLPQDLEGLADTLTACADALHERLMRALRRQQPLEDGLSQGAALVMFEQEVALRQQANSLYVDAATISLQGLGVTAAELQALAEHARQAVRRIEHRKNLAGIAAGLLGMAAAVASARPDHLAEALQDLKTLLAIRREDKSA